MPFTRVEPEKLSKTIVKQIEGLILRGILRPGERLPSERELSDRFGVSRPSLRDAIADLQQKGLLTTRAGAGIYISDVVGNVFSPALIDLFASHDAAVFDYIAFRRDLESISAERAARYGSDTDLKVIDALYSKMETAHQTPNPADEAQLDAQFHLAIAEASHNIIMLHMMRAMFSLLREGVFFNRAIMFNDHNTRDVLLDHHRDINAAIQARDGQAAKTALITHLDFIQTAFETQKKTEQNEEIAQLRYAHEIERG
jgi:GntR family transcriptional repressor for pyruvate dehydrogenase complex